MLLIRQAAERDIDQILKISREVYSESAAWTRAELRSHQEVFPEGQVVAVDAASDAVLGLAAGLIVQWDDYDIGQSWSDFTGGGRFTNHDPAGGTLYGAGVLVRRDSQGRGVGRSLYAARRAMVRRFGLRRIRAGARLSGYHRHAADLTAAEYVERVLAGELADPVLNFQLSEGFRVLAAVGDYLPGDPESLGYAAVIEWLRREGT